LRTCSTPLPRRRAQKTIALDVPGWPGHRAGQHVDVRLTAEDGYQAQRSYSIASAPDGTRIELTVELLDDGEVSPYLTNELRSSDQIELRGPVGGYFVWEPARGGPLLLVGGGSGVVPLMAMIRVRAKTGNDVETRLLFSSRSWNDVIYRDELRRVEGNGLRVVHTLTHSQPLHWTGYTRRVDAEMLAEVGPRPTERPHVHVCGRRRSSRTSRGRWCSLATTHNKSKPSASDPREAEMHELMLDGNAVAGLHQDWAAVTMPTFASSSSGPANAASR
jgi:ferredoxin-NADP reductase